MKSDRSNFEHHSKRSSRNDRLGNIEFYQQPFNSLIVSRVGKMVQSDGECLRTQIWGEVCLALEDLAQ